MRSPARPQGGPKQNNRNEQTHRTAQGPGLTAGSDQYKMNRDRERNGRMTIIDVVRALIYLAGIALLIWGAGDELTGRRKNLPAPSGVTAWLLIILSAIQIGVICMGLRTHGWIPFAAPTTTEIINLLLSMGMLALIVQLTRIYRHCSDGNEGNDHEQDERG